MSEQKQIEQAIAALEAQRVTLGDVVVDAALTALREKLAALESREHGQLQRLKFKVMRVSKAAELVEAKAHETLTYFAFPSNHWRQSDRSRRTIRSNESFARFAAAHARLAHFLTDIRR